MLTHYVCCEGRRLLSLCYEQGVHQMGKTTRNGVEVSVKAKGIVCSEIEPEGIVLRVTSTMAVGYSTPR